MNLADFEAFVKEAITDKSTEFDANFNQLLTFGEDKCVADLRLDIWKATEAVTLDATSHEVTLPDGFLAVVSLWIVVGDNRVFLEPRSYGYVIDYWPSVSQLSAPRYWAPYTATQIYITPPPDTDYEASVRGLKRPTSLLVDTSGTWLSTNAPRLLQLATMVSVDQFNIADERVEMWKKEYADELVRKQMEFRHLITPEFILPRAAGEQ